jgi:cytochrome P450
VRVHCDEKLSWAHSYIGYAVASPKGSSGSLLHIIDPAEHSQRRRIWDRAFTATAIKSYEPLLHARVVELENALAARTGQVIDLAEWFGYMTLDFMGDFGYGGAFNYMARASDSAMPDVREFMIRSLGRWEMLGAIPWVRPIVLALPNIGAKAWRNFAHQVVAKRIEKGSQVRDIFYYLVRLVLPSNIVVYSRATSAAQRRWRRGLPTHEL